MTDFKKLKVWQKAHVMALDVHRVAGRIRGAKHASLRSQMIRAAMSVPTSQVVEVRKMLYGLRHYLASRPEEGTGVQAKPASRA